MEGNPGGPPPESEVITPEAQASAASAAEARTAALVQAKAALADTCERCGATEKHDDVFMCIVYLLRCIRQEQKDAATGLNARLMDLQRLLTSSEELTEDEAAVAARVADTEEDEGQGDFDDDLEDLTDEERARILEMAQRRQR